MDWQIRIEDKLDSMSDKINDIAIVQSKQEENLREHMRRTALAEENIQRLHDELRPIQAHVTVVTGIIKIVGLLATIITVIIGILDIFRRF